MCNFSSTWATFVARFKCVNVTIGYRHTYVIEALSTLKNRNAPGDLEIDTKASK